MADLFVRSYPRTSTAASRGATVTIHPRPGIAPDVVPASSGVAPVGMTPPAPPASPAPPEEALDATESPDRLPQGHADQDPADRDHPPAALPHAAPPADLAAVAESDPPGPDLTPGSADPSGEQAADPIVAPADGVVESTGPGLDEGPLVADAPLSIDSEASPDASPDPEGGDSPSFASGSGLQGDQGDLEDRSGALGPDLDTAPVMAAAATDGAPAGEDEAAASSASPSTVVPGTGEVGHEDLLQLLRVPESTPPRVGPASPRVGPPGWDDATVAPHGHRHQEQRREENTMSECNCGKPGCTTCCVDCNTGWIQADLREGNLNFRTTETNASNNAQGAIRDVQLAKSQLAELSNRGFTAGALADCHTQQAVHHEGATSRLEQAHAELRAANIAAANAAVAASAACRTDQLVQTTAFQTQRDLATGFCDLKAKLAECCCEIKALVTAEGVQTRTFIGSLNVEDLRRRLAQCESATAAYFAGKVPPVIPTC